MRNYRLWSAVLVLCLVPSLSEATTAKLIWTDNANNETGSVIERRQSTEPGAYTQIGTVSADVTEYTDTLVAGSSVCYQVRAVNAAGSSGPSNEACVSIPTTEPPAAPSGVSVTVTVSVSSTAAPQQQPQQPEQQPQQPQGE